MRGAEQPDKTAASRSVLVRHLRARAAERASTGPAPPATQPASPPVPPARTPERAVAAAIGRAADRLHGLPLFFDRIVAGHAVLAEISELLPDPALISVVAGPGEAVGAVALCPGLLSALIEMQAVGRISARAPVVRRPTRTDGAICADFLNACLAELAAELSVLPGFHGLAGYRYASFLDDPRHLDLMLEDVAHHHISVTLRAGPAGQRDGRMVILLPAVPAPVVEPADGRGAAPLDAQAASRPPAQGALSAAVQATPINLVGVLCRRSITLGELRALAPGDLIALPPGALTGATLETTLGQQLFRGKLGELAGRHALRLTARTGVSSGAAAGDTLPGGNDEPSDLDNRGDPVAHAEPPIADLQAPDPFRDEPPFPDLLQGGLALDGKLREAATWADDGTPAALPQLIVG